MGKNCDSYLTTGEMAALAGLTAWTIRLHCRNKTIKGQQLANHQWRIPLSEASRFLKRGRAAILKDLKILNGK